MHLLWVYVNVRDSNFFWMEKLKKKKKKKVKNFSQVREGKEKKRIYEILPVKKQSHHGHYFSHGSTGYHSLISFTFCLMPFVTITRNMKKLPSPRQHLTLSHCSLFRLETPC
jgi:hypothetical protein